MSPALRTRYLLVAISLLAVVTVFMVPRCSWIRSDPNGSETPVVSLAAPEDGRRLADSDAGTIRFVRVPVEVPEGRAPSLDEATTILEMQHLGPLQGADLQMFVNLCERYLESERQEFEQRTIDPTDSRELLKEARMLYGVTLAEEALEAIARGSYVVTPVGEARSLTVPGAEVLGAGAMVNGEPANVAIIMSHEAFPRVREAREYVNAAKAFDDSEKARRFNSLPDAERAALAARIRGIWKRSSRSDADQRFLRETMGYTNRLPPGGDLLYALPRD